MSKQNLTYCSCLIYSTTELISDLQLSHATIGVAPSQYTLDMREQIKHSKELRKQHEKEEQVRKAKAYLISKITPRYTKNIIMKKIINYEVNNFLSVAKLPLQANDLAIVEKNIQTHLRPDLLYGYETGTIPLPGTEEYY